MKKHHLVILIFFYLTFRPSFAELLIIQSSDNHSKYKRIDSFIKSTHKLIEDFKAKYPNGEVVFNFNGDYSGASSFSNFKGDKGKLGLELMGALAKEHTVLFTFGNHEAFDWLVDGIADDLFYEHLKYLDEKGVISLGSNTKLKERSQKYFKDKYDHYIGQNHKVRFLGLQLETFYEKVPNHNGNEVGEVLEVDGYEATLKREIVKAKEAGVQSLVASYHDTFGKVVKVTKKINDLLPSSLKIPVSFAAHDHVVDKTVIGEATNIIDSGSNFDFSAVVLNNDGVFVSHEFFDKEKQLDISSEVSDFPDYLRKVGRKISKHVEDVRKLKSTGEKRLSVIKESKLTLKKSRSTVLGDALGDALVMHGNKELSLEEKSKVKGIIGMFNSSSYRNDSILDTGYLDEFELREMFPIKNEVNILKMTGEDIQIFFESLRRFREKEGIFTPQMSKNIREKANFRLEFEGQKGWQALDKKGSYYVVVDHWLAINGYAIPEHDGLDLASKVISKESTFEVFRRYLYESLKENYSNSLSCTKLLQSVL